MERYHQELRSIGLTLLVMAGLAPTLRAGEWWMQAGPIHRHNMKLSLRGSSHVQGGGVQPAPAFYDPAAESRLGLRGVNPPVPGTGVLPLTGFADRSFDNGFVHIGSTTGVGGSLTPDHTWFWGYDDASQIDTMLNTITFNTEVTTANYSGNITDVSRATRRTVDVLRDEPIHENRELSGTGVEILFGRDLLVQTGRTVSVIGGLNGLWGENRSFQARPWEQTVRTRKTDVTSEYSFTDTFTAHDLYVYLLEDPMGKPVPPRAPGDPGTFNGLPLPSPLIPNVPDSHQRTDESLDRVSSGRTTRRNVSDRTVRYWNEVDLDVETEAFQLFAGGQWAVEREKVAFFVSGRATLNLLEIDVERNEVLVSDEDGGPRVLRMWRDQADDQTVAMGFGLSGGVEFYLDEVWFLRAEFGRDWIFDEAKVRVGPNTVEFDASGYTSKLLLGRNL
ncbi:MAG: hypothetical protein AAF492_18980 [Verrucomicrobiota bacterium]